MYGYLQFYTEHTSISSHFFNTVSHIHYYNVGYNIQIFINKFFIRHFTFSKKKKKKHTYEYTLSTGNFSLAAYKSKIKRYNALAHIIHKYTLCKHWRLAAISAKCMISMKEHVKETFK